MQKLITIAILLLSLFAVSAVADEFTGISDSKCGAKGASAQHKDCAAIRGGAAPVFVMDSKVLESRRCFEGRRAHRSESHSHRLG